MFRNLFGKKKKYRVRAFLLRNGKYDTVYTKMFLKESEAEAAFDEQIKIYDAVLRDRNTAYFKDGVIEFIKYD